MNAASAQAHEIDVEAMRARANEFLNSLTLPRYETVQHAEHLFQGDLRRMIPAVEKLTGTFGRDDLLAKVALAGVGEARRRCNEIERAGLTNEFERVKRLARSVLALCDHHDTLSGTAMCLACDMPIRPDDDTLPYDRISPSGGAAKSGRIHTGCTNAVRRA